ncbi:MAG TPA: HEPN domain-containing protein [Acidobacteriota bacterium]|jgi:hypothetical protein|nr:HEPN domain-containing protein [Acidobacteriota bacterium]
MTPENARSNAGEEAKLGQDTLAEAQHLLGEGFYKGAVSRAYYAAYHYARALLFLKGLDPKTHQGVIQLLGLHFVKTGILTPIKADILPRLETLRGLSDYHAEADFKKADAEQAIRDTQEFLDECSKILTRHGVHARASNSVGRSRRKRPRARARQRPRPRRR